MVRDITKFSGKRQVTSLSIYPCTYADLLDGGKTRQAVVKRGKRAHQILREMPKQTWYDGFTDTSPKKWVGDLIPDSPSSI